MRSRRVRQRPGTLRDKLRRAYRYSELRKLQLWLKGKTLHWALYLASVTILAGSLLGLHHYYSQYFYVVSLGGRELGMVKDAGEIEIFLDELNECCSTFYGMAVEPEQEIAYNREYRSGGEEDAYAVKEALKQQITLITEAVMLTVDQMPAVPLTSEEDIDRVIDLLSDAYTRQAENVRLLQTNLVEEVACVPCTISPEDVCAPEEAAELLLSCNGDNEAGRLLESRYGEPVREDGISGMVLPLVHVQTVEEVKTVEKIPFATSYTYNDEMWHAQSNVLIPGEEGEKAVTYHVTRENGKEVNRQIVEQTVLQEPVTRLVEKGTARAPSIGTGTFVWPVAGGGVISQYYSGYHRAIDITALGCRSPILAADSGVVVEAGSRGSLGNYIVLYHGSYYTVYAHNSSNYVSSGDSVSRGQTIALMGNTGRTYGRTGIHLHFEVRRSDGSGVWGGWYKNPPLNPLNFFNP